VPTLKQGPSASDMLEALDGMLKGLSLRYPSLLEWQLEFRRTYWNHPERASGPQPFREKIWRDYAGALLATAEREESPWIKNIVHYLAQTADWARTENHVNTGQMSSKLWLVEELKAVKPDLGIVYILGGWYGALASLIHADKIEFKKIVNFELDSGSAEVSKIFNAHLGEKFAAENRDMMALRLGENVPVPDTLVNTSCEHLPNFDEWFQSIPAGVFVCLQSNDYFAEPEHCNCVPSLEEFQRRASLARTLAAKQMLAPKGKYNRFLLLGYK
jgi:hypothetical protein